MAWRIKDGARQLGVCTATIYNLRRAGKVRLVKIAGRTLIPDSEMIRLVSEGT
jgi:hypothetical protein